MPYTTVVTGTAITATWGNTTVRDQLVVPFTDAAARTSAISSPVNGMLSTLTTTDRLDIYNGSSWSAVVAPSNGALTVWVPVVVQNGVVSTTTNEATCIRIGRWIEFTATVTATGAGTASNVVSLSLPVVAKATYGVYSLLGEGYLADVSVPQDYVSLLRSASTTTVKMTSGIAPVGSTYLGSTNFTAALAAGDIISYSGRYEAAGDA